MINKPPPFKDLNIRIPFIIPIKGSGFINPGSGLMHSSAKLSFFSYSWRSSSTLILNPKP